MLLHETKALLSIWITHFSYSAIFHVLLQNMMISVSVAKAIFRMGRWFRALLFFAPSKTPCIAIVHWRLCRSCCKRVQIIHCASPNNWLLHESSRGFFSDTFERISSSTQPSLTKLFAMFQENHSSKWMFNESINRFACAQSSLWPLKDMWSRGRDGRLRRVPRKVILCEVWRFVVRIWPAWLLVTLIYVLLANSPIYSEGLTKIKSPRGQMSLMMALESTGSKFNTFSLLSAINIH